MMAVLMSRVESTRPPGVRSMMTSEVAPCGVGLRDRPADVGGRDRMDDAVDLRGVDDRWRALSEALALAGRGRGADESAASRGRGRQALATRMESLLSERADVRLWLARMVAILLNVASRAGLESARVT